MKPASDRHEIELIIAERSLNSARILNLESDGLGMINRIGNSLRLIGEVLMRNDREPLSDDYFLIIAGMLQQAGPMLRCRPVNNKPDVEEKCLEQ